MTFFLRSILVKINFLKYDSVTKIKLKLRLNVSLTLVNKKRKKMYCFHYKTKQNLTVSGFCPSTNTWVFLVQIHFPTFTFDMEGRLKNDNKKTCSSREKN